MNTELSMREPILTTEKSFGGSQMENKAAQMIREMKQIKEDNKISHMDIMEKMQEIDESKMASLSTLRRIFRDGSESNASSFNYEEILVPVYNAVKQFDKKPREKSPFEKELDGFRAVIRVQDEELNRLIEIKEHLDDRVEFLVSQIKVKDEMIKDIMKKLDEKDAVIKRLMDKCL